MDTKHQLRRLLRSASDKASCECLTALDDVSRGYRAGGSLPTDQMKSTYGVRAKINVRNGSPICGFDGLISGLDAFSASRLTIHSIGIPSEELFLVFTDVSVTEIIGILRIPPKTSNEHEPQAVAVAAS